MKMHHKIGAVALSAAFIAAVAGYSVSGDKVENVQKATVQTTSDSSSGIKLAAGVTTLP